MFHGTVLVSPLIRADPLIGNPVNKLLAKVFALVYPDFESFQSADVSLVTSDPQWVNIRESDPLSYHGGFLAGQAHAVNLAIEDLNKGMKNMTTPFLIMISEKDRLTDPKASFKFFKSASSLDKQLLEFNSGLHNFFIEKKQIREKAIAKTLEWIYARV